MKNTVVAKFVFILMILTGCSVFVSCRRSMGYSVLLWDVPEKNLQDGQVVKVFIKSNISHVYVIGLPDTNENMEIPLWQLTEPVSKKKLPAVQEKYGDYQHHYAKIKVDGLPVRKTPDNTAKQVYRLHKDEVVKILYKGQGQDVLIGKNQKLEGDWLCVLTQGGTEGWCFSYNLNIFQTGKGGEIVAGYVEEEVVETEDTLLNQVLQAKWYPETYTRLLRDNTIDLETMKSDYGFDTGAASGKVTINIKDRYRTANYGGIKKIRDSVYDFTGTPFQLIIRSGNLITVNYTGNDGKPEAYNFVTISDDYDIPEILDAERKRRNDEIQKLYNVDSFTSSNYGTLIFSNGNTFSWNGYSLLVPGVISASAKGRGTVSMKYLISSDLKKNYDGVLTFRFEGNTDEVNFLYKLSSNGLSMEDATDATIKNNIVQSRSKSPIVIFFSR